MKQTALVENLTAAIEPVLENMGFELVMVEFVPSPSGQTLRVYMDHPDGVNLDMCSLASEAISRRLDELDIVRVNYNLEVSSPGLERPLARPKDFKRFTGGKVTVKTVEKIEGRRKFTGRIIAAGGSGFEIETDKGPVHIEYEQVKKANLVLDL